MRGMACDMNVSDKMMKNIVKTDLKLLSLKMQTCQCLTDLQKEKRLDRAKILLNKLKACMGTDKIIFSDEKLFTVEAICNCPHHQEVWLPSSPDLKAMDCCV